MRAAAGRRLAATETFDDPDGIDAGFWREKFVDRAFPLGLHVVAFRRRCNRRPERRVSGGGMGEFSANSRSFSRRAAILSSISFLPLASRSFSVGEEFFVERDGIALLPVCALLFGNVFGGIVLGVAAAAEGFGFDEDGAFAGAGAFDGFLGRGVNGDNVVAIDDVAGDAVGFGAIGKIFERHLAAHGRGIRPKIIFENEDERGFLGGGEIQAFMENAGGAAAIADPGHGDDFLAEVAAGHGNAGHDGNEIAEHGDGRDDVEIIEIAEMAGAVFAFGGRSVLGHVLRENVARGNAFDEERADVADHRSHPVAFLERVGGADGNGFLAEAGVEAADDFVLAEKFASWRLRPRD